MLVCLISVWHFFIDVDVHSIPPTHPSFIHSSVHSLVYVGPPSPPPPTPSPYL